MVCLPFRSGKINIASLPKTVREHMGAFDFDKDGTVTTDEITAAARLFEESKVGFTYYQLAPHLLSTCTSPPINLHLTSYRLAPKKT